MINQHAVSGQIVIPTDLLPVFQDEIFVLIEAHLVCNVARMQWR